MSSSNGSAIGRWLEGRLGRSGPTQERRSQRVGPERWERLLRAVAALLLLLLAASGLLLALHYQPAAAEAHRSVLWLGSAVPFGAVIRGVHAWSADLLVAVAYAYLFLLAVRRSYRQRGELRWLAALAAVALILALAFSGALLPWSRQAHAHARVGAALVAHLPLVGGWLRRLLLGGDHVTAVTLARAYAVHVAVLPALLAVVLLVHRRLSKRESSSDGAAPGAQRPLPLYPHFAARVAAAGTGVLLLVATLATFWPRSFGDGGELSLPSPTGAGPPWYLACVHALVRGAPASMLGVEGPRFLAWCAAVLVLLLVLLPFLDHRGSRVTQVAAWVALGAWVALSGYGFV